MATKDKEVATLAPVNEPGTVDAESQYKRARQRVQELKGFYTHAMVYVVVNAGLIAINLLSSPGTRWFIWPLLVWGMGLAIHAMVVFGIGRFLTPQWEERKTRELMEQERRRGLHGPV